MRRWLENRQALQAEVERQKQDLDALSSSAAVRSLDWMAKLATPEEKALLDELAEMRSLVSEHMNGAERKKVARPHRSAGRHGFLAGRR